MRDRVSMAAAATERCGVWPKTAAHDVKCVQAHCRGAGSSRHPAIFRLKLHRMSPRRSHNHPLSLVLVNLLLLRTIVLTLAIISSFLDVDGRPERRSFST